MLVKKGDIIVRNGQPYEVVVCDEEYFIIGAVTYNPDAGCNTTSFLRLEAYSNDETVNSLADLNFAKRIKPENWAG